MAASGQPTDADLAARIRLIEQIQPAITAGNHALALDLATRAGRIRMTPSLRLTIAQEQQATGRTAEALSSASLCVRETERDPTIANREQILARCREVAEANRTKVGNLTVNVPPGAPADLVVEVAGTPLNNAFFGTAYTVTPGKVVVIARATGMQEFHAEVTVALGGNESLDVVLTPAAGSSTTPTTTRGGVSGGAIGVLAAGAVVMGLSGVFFALRNGQIATLDMYCNTNTMGPVACDNTPAVKDALSGATTWNAMVNVSLAVGGAAVLAGGIWLIVSATSGGGRERATASMVMPTIIPRADGTMIGLTGRF